MQTSGRSSIALCALGLSVALGGACGGRAVTIEDGSPTGVAANTGAGAAAGAGTGATGGKASGGTGSGGKSGSSSAGAPSAGAGNNCGFTACPSIACGSGASLITPPGACCPVCQSDCVQQPCPDLLCPSGYQLQAQPGQCCPACVPNPTIDCATGQKNYAQFRDTLLSKYAYGCNSSADCVAVAPSNRCESGCSYVAVWSTALADLNSNLAGDAMMDCAACSPTPVPPCLPPAPPVCVSGQCVLMIHTR
jgi:hypothetical protein